MATKRKREVELTGAAPGVSPLPSNSLYVDLP